MSKIKIKKNDKVVCLAGKDKGKKGKVLKVFRDKGTALVEGLNMGKKHTKARPPKIPQGGIIEKALPIHVSNLMLVCSSCDKPARTGFKVAPEGKERTCKKCGQTT
ncbi:MAG: 50S ribosomal protein L24 [Armatimonadota bacterium]